MIVDLLPWHPFVNPIDKSYKSRERFAKRIPKTFNDFNERYNGRFASRFSARRVGLLD